MASISTVVTQLLLEAALIALVRTVFKTMPSPSTLQAYLVSLPLRLLGAELSNMSFGLADITAFSRFHTRDAERMPRGGGAFSIGGRGRFLFLEQALLLLLLVWILWRRWFWFGELLWVSFLVPLTRKSLSLAHHS